jgi:hypothetical protein
MHYTNSQACVIATITHDYVTIHNTTQSTNTTWHSAIIPGAINNDNTYISFFINLLYIMIYKYMNSQIIKSNLSQSTLW